MSSGTRIQRSSGGTNNKGNVTNNVNNTTSTNSKSQNAVNTKKINSAGENRHGQDVAKNQDKIQPTAEQMRIAQIMDVRMDDPGIREKVLAMMETTFRSEEEVCSALHDCDNDVERAVNLLFETNTTQTAWETSVKKKKNRLNSTSGNQDSRTNNVGHSGDAAEDWDAAGQGVSVPNDDNQQSLGHGTGQHNNVSGNGPHRGSTRGRGGPRGGRRGNLDSRGWRGREARENERNNSHQDEGTRSGGYQRGVGDGVGNSYHRDRRGGRGGMGGRGYGGRGGRGGRAGGSGGRTFQPRMDSRTQHRNNANDDHVENWDDEESTKRYNNGKTGVFPFPEDWDNEEYTGSLADTKVFTPSENPSLDTQQYGAPDGQYSAAVTGDSGEVNEGLQMSGSAGAFTNNIGNHVGQSNMPEIHPAPTAAQQLTQALEIHSNPVNTQVTGSLSAEQTQYFTTLTQQNTQSVDMKNPQGLSSYAVTTGSTVYMNSSVPLYVAPQQMSYANGSTPSYAGAVQESSGGNTSQQRKQRARVPPPSKIPATAVEMPADLNTSVGFLDVQFGALEFGSDTSSFDGNLDSTNSSIISNSKYDSSLSSIPVSQNQQVGTSQNADVSLDSNYKPTPSNTSQSSQMMSGDGLPQISEHNLNSVPNYNSQNRNNSSCISPANVNNSSSTVVDQLSLKTDNHSYSQPANSVSQYQTNSYTKTQSAYQNPAPYYSNTQQQQSVNSYSQPMPSTFNSNSSVGVAYPNTSSSVSVGVGYPSQSLNTSSSSSASTGYSSQSVPSGAGVQLGYSSQNTFSAAMNQQVGGYPAQNQNSYQNSTNNQSVYGTNAALANTSSYSTSNSIPANITSGQYNNYSSSATSHKLPSKDSQYENTASASSNLASTTSSVSSPVLGLTTPASSTVSKSTSSTGNSNKTPTANANSSSALVPSSTSVGGASSTTNSGTNSGLTASSGGMPVIGQYIMGQAGVPFYQQPLYSFEELQMLQQRMPHVAAGYYNMGYQTPTTLSTGREGTIGSVAYSMPDGRFTRADSNASPVPSTLSQPTATGQHTGGPMLNPALPPGYMEAAYYYGGGMMPGSYQYGTPAIYPQMATTANAHGSTTSSQYPKPSYSGYNTGYESLSQSQDYTKQSVGGSYGPSGNVSGSAVVPQVSGKSSAAAGSVGANSQGGTVPSSGNNSDITSAMYSKGHTALNKVNSYEKQTFHSGTPPPFNLTGSSSGTTYGAPHLFIPTMPPHQQPHHNTQLLHQPLHQIYGGTSQVSSHRDSGNGTGQRSQSSSQAKSSSKQGYSQSAYWTPN